MSNDLSPRARALVDFVAERIDTQQTPEFTRIDERALTLTVCTSLSDPAATKRANMVPPGPRRWVLSDDPEAAPVPCDEKPTHRHLIFEC